MYVIKILDHLKNFQFPKTLTLISLKMDSLLATGVAAAAETIPPKNIPTSLVHIYTCHLKKKLVKNNEKQGRYDQKRFVSKKPKKFIHFSTVCKNVHKAQKFISLYSRPLTSYLWSKLNQTFLNTFLWPKSLIQPKKMSQNNFSL